jgi:hypothetical protein
VEKITVLLLLIESILHYISALIHVREKIVGIFLHYHM